MADYTVQFIFNDGSGEVILPLVYQISDPKEAIKATIIEGTRGDGSIVIPAFVYCRECTNWHYGLTSFSQTGDIVETWDAKNRLPVFTKIISSNA
jgi:hypothetical protein